MAYFPRTRAAVAALCCISSLAALGVERTTPSAQAGPVQTKGPCRTYDTSATSVTAGGPVQATVEISGVFDPWSLRMVQNVTMSSNQGAHFSNIQTSTWDSAEDFIAEVVRLKPPAVLPTSPGPQPVNDIIPPLTRSRSTIGSGQIGFAQINSFDGTNRLTGFQSRTQGGTSNVRYSAWDSSGRPTAGTMQSPVSSSTVQFSYDEKARTQTQTTTTSGITSTITTTYDQNGNMRASNSSVTRGTPSTTTWTSHSSATVCLGDLRPPTPVAPKPAGPNPNGTFSATIGGQSWTAAQGVHADNMAPVVSVGGSDKRYIVSIGVSAKQGLGEYKAGPPDSVDFTKLTAAQFKELMERNSVVAMVIDTVTKQAWHASPTIGKGTVNLSSIAGAAAGTFSLTLDPVPNTGASGSLSFNGSFNIRF